MSLLAFTSPMDRLLFRPRKVELFICFWESFTIISVLLSLADNVCSGLFDVPPKLTIATRISTITTAAPRPININ